MARDDANAAAINDSALFGLSKHDLLTLVNHILGFTELLLDDADTMPAPEVGRLKAIEASGRRLNVLLDSLYDPSTAKQKRHQLGLDGIREQLRQPLNRIVDDCEGLLDEESGQFAEDLRKVHGAARRFLDVVDQRAGAVAAVQMGGVAPAALAAGGAMPRKGTFDALVVDDHPDNRSLLARHLTKLGFTVHQAEDGRRAMTLIRSRPVDVVLLDVMMPEMDGFQVLAQIKANEGLRHIPVIMISALDEMDAVTRCIENGAADYLPKPFDPVLLKARVGACVDIKRLHDKDAYYRQQIEEYNLALEDRVREQVREISLAQQATIFALSKLAESRDPETGDHLERMREYCRLLARKMRDVPKLHGIVDGAFVECIYAASPLHDIGKVGVQDDILRKPGKLTPEEFEVMKTHTSLGAETLRAVYQAHPANDFIRMGIEIAECHHEKWNGSGYPLGLAGEAIPLSARILALADVYDAMRSKRCYKDPMPHEEVRKILLEQRAIHFDPDVVEAFLAIEKDFLDVAKRFA